MTTYTTGELARSCGVSVRTVQYYDTRGILIPTALSEGGRRIYTDEDRQRLRVICYLRDLDLPIDAIKSILSEPHPEQTLDLLLDQQTIALRGALTDTQAKLDRIRDLRKSLDHMAPFSVESIADAVHVMENRSRLRHLRWTMLLVGLLMDALQLAGLALWLTLGGCQYFILSLVLAACLGVWIFLYYTERTAYICPQCHQVFQPTRLQNLFANHTPNTRRLTCPHCHRTGFCVETAKTAAE